MLVYFGSRQTHPGVAKFGIALEWGSRGLEFESRHSDHKNQNNFCCSGFFFSCGEIRTIKCECPVDIRLPTAGRKRHLSIPNLDTRFVFLSASFFPLIFPNTRQPFSAKLSAGSKHSRMRHCQSAVPVLPRDGAFLSGYRNQQHCLCVYLFIHIIDPFNFSNC